MKKELVNSKTNDILPVDKSILQFILLCVVLILIAKLAANIIIIGLVIFFLSTLIQKK